MALSSSAPAPFRHPKHQVFLSFRGEDTRNNFLYHLYEAFRRKGIGAYADFKELPRGEEISPALLKAIEESMISMIVFSQNYATSSWCLEELSKIMECRQSRGQLVVPIFHHVNPSDIRKQTGSFGKAFVEHERNRIDKVQGWRHALTEAGNLSGWSLAGDKPEPLIIEDIVRDIVNKLNRLSKRHNNGLVGIGPHMEQIKSLLCIGGEDVRIIGIWGMGGIGKTTLAQAIYDEVYGQFDSCCFLANVREETERHGAIALRDKLLSKLLNEENFHVGTPRIGSTIIKDRLCCKRVLVVFDDVNDFEQLKILAISHDHFGSGSRIIVTSRDKNILINGSVDGIYEVKELSYDDSLQLFSLFAFRKNHLVDDLKDLSNSFLEYAKGVPIALEVLGSTLYRQNIAYWESALNRLKQYPNARIQNVLKISFDALDEVDKKIFLDIACFFKDYDRDNVTNILDSSYYGTAHSGITNLIDKCLLKVTKCNELGMHDLLQEMGKNVVCAESQRPRKRTRLWTPSDVCRVLKNGKVCKSIEGVLLDQSQIDEAHLNPRAFARMHNLRIIKFYGKGGKLVLLHRGLKSLPKKLRYLEWEHCMLKSLPSNFSPENLVELKLPRSNVEQLWNGKQNLVNLRVLDLFCCMNLTKIPDLSTAINIQRLKIDGCKRLVELPSMIHLKSISRFLSITGCDKLKKFPELPQHIDMLVLIRTKIEEIPEVPRNLQFLHLSRNQIEEIPSSIGCHNKLAHLRITGCRIHNLPSTIVQLNALENITLSDCPNITKFPNLPENVKCLALVNTSIEEVPSSISKLKNLTNWCMRGSTKLKSLPTSICELKSLERLDLGGCSNLEHFPEIFKTMQCLINLDLSETAIEEVPSSILRLKSLTSWSMIGSTKLRSLPTSICELKSLQTLDLLGCSNFECFPKILKIMECLVTLNLSETAIEEVPSSISTLKSLTSWSMRRCTKLKSLPTIICELKSLERLDLGGCSNFECFPEILKIMECLVTLDLSETAIEEVPSSISRLKSLTSWSMRGCTKLKSLPTSICELKSLQTLDLLGCSNLECVPNTLKTMECLISLKLSRTAIEVLLPSNISGLGDCRNLSIHSSICNLVILKELHLNGSDIVEIPRSIKELSNLISLYLRSCKSLKSLPKLPPCLRVLDADGCISLQRVSKWEQFPYMKAQRYQLENYNYPGNCFTFKNCFKLDPDAVKNIVANLQLRIQCMAKELALEPYKGARHVLQKSVLSCFPESEISETFKNRRTNSSITVQLTPACSSKRFLGFALCIVVDFKHHLDIRNFKVICNYRLKTKCGDHHNFEETWHWPSSSVQDIRFESNHVILLFKGFESEIIETSRNNRFVEVSFDFYIKTTDFEYWNEEHIKVQKCGVNVIYVDAERSSYEVESGTNYRSDGEETVDPTNETMEACCHANLSFTQGDENRCDASMSEPNCALGPNRLSVKCNVNNRDLEGSMMEEDANNEEGLDDLTTAMRPRLKRSFSSPEEEEPEPQRLKYVHYI